MKKLVLILLTAALLTVTSCGGKGQSEETDTAQGDWRNKIEYEGSFFVSESIKLLYALDTGTITLWDNKGSGDVLQVLKYDTSVSDAIERLEKKDLNGDGFTDLTTVFYETASEIKYNLWLWDNGTRSYTPCSIYKSIPNPVPDPESKTVTGTRKTEDFGTVSMQYRFTDGLSLDPVVIQIENAEEIGLKICENLLPGSTVTPAPGNATVNGTVCSVLIAEAGGASTGYIAYDTDASWYIDTGCVGAYKIIEADGGTYKAGEYTDDAGKAAEICRELCGEEGAEITVARKLSGKIEDEDALCFIMQKNGAPYCALYKSSKEAWFFKAEGDDTYYLVSSAGTAQLVEPAAVRFITE